MSVATAELVARFGSPLFVYDGDAVAAAYARLRAALPDDVAIHYAVKANPALGILALLVRAGAGLEIASEGELAAALAVGCAPERILFAGPGKRDAELAAALDAGVHGIHCESAGELARLDALARAAGRRVRCGLRVQVPWAAREERRILGGGEATKFGVPESEARARVAEWTRFAALEITGLHVFNATNVLDADALLASARRTLLLACDLADAGLPLERVDFGGGLGVPYDVDAAPLDVEAYGRGLARLADEVERERGRRFALVIEPGRWLVAQAGEFVCRVVDLKSQGGVEFAVLDGGVQHLLRPALVGQAHPARVLGPARAGEPRRVRLVGPLCTALDDFGEVLLPPLRVGDLIALGCAGAYGFTEAMSRFLSHAEPAEVLRWRGDVHVLRPRREAVEHLRGQHVPEALREVGRVAAGYAEVARGAG